MAKTDLKIENKAYLLTRTKFSLLDETIHFLMLGKMSWKQRFSVIDSMSGNYGNYFSGKFCWAVLGTLCSSLSARASFPTSPHHTCWEPLLRCHLLRCLPLPQAERQLLSFPLSCSILFRYVSTMGR